MISDTIKRIQESIDNDLDKSKFSAFYNLFVLPSAQIVDPLENRIRRIEEFQGLRNPGLLDDEDVDKVATNFLVFRNEGQAGQCAFKVVVKEKKQIVINQGALASVQINGTEYTFTFDGASISDSNLQANSTYGKLYVSNISVTARTGVDQDYRAVPKNTIVKPLSDIDPNIAYFVLESFIEPTVTREDNLSLYIRLLSTAGNKNLDSEAGVRNLFAENFPDVPVIAIFGNADPEVKRNEMKVYVPVSNNEFTSLNFKGKNVGDSSVPHKAYEFLITSTDEYSLDSNRLVPGAPYLFTGIEASQEDYNGLQSAFSPSHFTTGYNILLSKDNFKIKDNWSFSDQYVGYEQMYSDYEIVPSGEGFILGNTLEEYDYKNFIKDLMTANG